jgi:hypothetical protein
MLVIMTPRRSVPCHASTDLIVGALISAHQHCIQGILIIAMCKILPFFSSGNGFVDNVQCQRGDTGTGRQICHEADGRVQGHGKDAATLAIHAP